MADQEVRWLLVSLQSANGVDVTPNDVARVFKQCEGHPPEMIKRTGGGWLAGPLDPPKQEVQEVAACGAS